MNALQVVAADGPTIARRNIIKIKRVPGLFVFTALSPIMFVPFEIRSYQKVVSR